MGDKIPKQSEVESSWLQLSDGSTDGLSGETYLEALPNRRSSSIGLNIYPLPPFTLLGVKINSLPNIGHDVHTLCVGPGYDHLREAD